MSRRLRSVCAALPHAALLSFVVLAATPTAEGAPATQVRSESDEVTFTRDVAPILHERCAACHRPGESAPFSLLTFDDARRRARQIGIVTTSRFMPPWLPAPGTVTFAHERRLTDEEVGTIARWVEAGAPEGDPADMPEPPQRTEGWQLGTPDLVLDVPEAFVVPADGVDVFRNLVIPVSIDGPRYVKAVELRPGNPAVVHHAIIQVDRTRTSRRLDAEDPEPGFGGMSMGDSGPPDGTFLGWTPGKVAMEGDEEAAWRLDSGVDLVLQLHLLPSGKPEPVRPRIGLHFADGPPAVRPSLVMLRNDEIDIPPGAAQYVVTDEMELPVPVEALLVYPHAHYLGKDLKAYATHPDGTRQWLVHIPDWDFNWQDEYRYAPPLLLPAGTVLSLEYTYDNSAANVRNPNHPPLRVTYGNQSSDEMATLALQVRALTSEARAELEAAIARKGDEDLMASARQRLRIAPDDPRAYDVLGSAYRSLGRTEEAIGAFEQAVRLRPDYVDARLNLGGALGEVGRHRDAVEQFQHALELEPGNADAFSSLGVALEAVGRRGDAIESFRRALALQEDHANAHYNLGSALARQGDGSGAIRHMRRAMALRPDHLDTRINLAIVLAGAERRDEAIVLLEGVLADAPGSAPAAVALGNIHLARGDDTAAIAQYRAALAANPDETGAHANLALALRRRGDIDGALEAFRQAVARAPERAELQRELAVTYMAQRRFAEAVEPLQMAIELAPGDVGLRLNLAFALTMSGRAPEAESVLRAAVRIAPSSVAAHSNLALLLATTRRHAEALPMFRQALVLDGNDLVALRGLAWLHATCPDAELRDPAEAIRLAVRANQLTGSRNPMILDALAAAQASAGRFPEAAATARQAAAAAAANPRAAAEIRARIELYERGEAYIER